MTLRNLYHLVGIQIGNTFLVSVALGNPYLNPPSLLGQGDKVQVVCLK